jgi:hypothetical protein
LASIQALALQNGALEQRNRELEAVIQSLVASNQEQETRLAQLEAVETQVADLRALVVQLLPQVAQN